ncbi:MAG: flavin reductase family protein [Caulobacterales bacterium]|nr:flavin reductase family protein [Caulobacterales bacterium]
MERDQSVDAQAFRQAMACFATGVAVVGVAPAAGPLGMTVNSLTSVSLEPPLLLWCLGRQGERSQAFAAADRFAVGLLAADQEGLARRFAADAAIPPGDPAMEAGGNGAPLARGALAWLECDTSGRHVEGDHLVIIGRVTRVARPTDGAGLVYFRSAYGKAD